MMLDENWLTFCTSIQMYVLSGLVNPSGTGSSSYFSLYALHDYTLSVMLQDFAMWFVLFVIDHAMPAAQFMNVDLMKHE